MLKIENLVLTKEMITALKEVRNLQNSGNTFSVDDVKNPLTNLYSENLLEPLTLDVNGEKLMSCTITDYGVEVLKKIDEEEELKQPKNVAG